MVIDRRSQRISSIGPITIFTKTLSWDISDSVTYQPQVGGSWESVQGILVGWPF